MIAAEVAIAQVDWYQIATNVVSIIVAVAAFSVSIWLFLKTPLGWALRWVWRKAVSEPVAAWNRTMIGEVVQHKIEHLMHHRNGGSSLLDLADSVERVSVQVRDLNDRLTDLPCHTSERDVSVHTSLGNTDEGETNE